jgi:hypothetical protein
VLFFTVGGSSDDHAATASRSARKRAAGPKLQASLGFGNVRLAGEF